MCQLDLNYHVEEASPSPLPRHLIHSPRHNWSQALLVTGGHSPHQSRVGEAPKPNETRLCANETLRWKSPKRQGRAA